jgi:hypothetical protein
MLRQEINDACVNEVDNACVNEVDNACVNEVDNEVNSELGTNRDRRPRSDEIQAWWEERLNFPL